LLPTGTSGVLRGYLRLFGTSRILGSVSYGFNTPGGGSAAGFPLEPKPFRARAFQAFFSGKQGTEKYYSGLALLNPVESPAEVIVKAVDDGGNLSAEAAVHLGPLEGKVMLLEDLFGTGFSMPGGRLRLDSSSPIYGLALAGNDRGTLLSAIPATEIR
jgi:hypothetical protein